MCAHAVLNLLNELGEKDKMRGFAKHLSVFPNGFNNFNNTGAWMQDSIYHMIFISHFISDFELKHRNFGFRKCGILWTSTHNITT